MKKRHRLAFLLLTAVFFNFIPGSTLADGGKTHYECISSAIAVRLVNQKGKKVAIKKATKTVTKQLKKYQKKLVKLNKKLLRKPERAAKITPKIETLQQKIVNFNNELALINECKILIEDFQAAHTPCNGNNCNSSSSSSTSSSSSSASSASSSTSSTSSSSASSSGFSGGPAIFVDNAPSMTTDCLNENYSIANRNCSGSDGMAYRSIQAALNQATLPGSNVEIRAGDYIHGYGSDIEFITIANQGTAEAPIRIEGFGNERPILSGRGCNEVDLNHDGEVDPDLNPDPPRAEALIWVTSSAHDIILANLELTNSNRWGLMVEGSFNTFEKLRIHKTCDNSITVQGGAHDDLFRENELYHSAHGSGVLVWFGNHLTFENNLSYEHGRYSNGNRVFTRTGDSQGGGNSDGFGLFKGCYQEAPPFGNDLCDHMIWKGNVTFGNIDDGFDMYMGYATLIDNISFNVGPSGTYAFKLYTTNGRSVLVRNIAANVNITGTAASYDQAFRGFILGQPNAVFLNNGAFNMSGDGFSLSMDTMVFKNNISNNNVDWDFKMNCNGCAAAANLNSDNTGVEINSIRNTDPQLNNPLPTIDVSFSPAMSPLARLNAIKNQFKAAFGLKLSSPARDNGVNAAYPNFQSGGENTLTYTGSAPDIGPFERSSTN